MNRRERRAAAKGGRDFAPVAQQLAQKLVAHCPEPDWPQRYVLFTAGGFARERHGCTKMTNPARKCTSGVSVSGSV
jgi:hypothetical protein